MAQLIAQALPASCFLSENRTSSSLVAKGALTLVVKGVFGLHYLVDLKLSWYRMRNGKISQSVWYVGSYLDFFARCRVAKYWNLLFNTAACFSFTAAVIMLEQADNELFFLAGELNATVQKTATLVANTLTA
jgi:hypothetical protein